MLNELREHLDYFAGITSDGPAADPSAVVAFADLVRELLSEPTNVQALALARLMRDHGKQAYVMTAPFDLPTGYWGVRFTNGFECGIAPDGSVSS